MIPPKAAEKCRRRIDKVQKWRYEVLEPVSLEAAETMEHFRSVPERLDWKPAPLGSKWGEHWGTVWFRASVTIPAAARGRRVFYRQTTDFERLLYVNGEPFGGMDPYHPEALLMRKAKGGEKFRLHVEAYAGHPMWEVDPFDNFQKTMHSVGWSIADPPLAITASELVAERETVNALWYEADVLLRTALMLDENSLRRAQVLDTLNAALDLVPMEWQTEEELEAGAKAARKLLAPVLARENGPSTPTVGVVGHAHIDVGWLWPVRESIRKCARTFSTVLNLMDEHPALTFQQSQAVLYDMVERHYPALLDRIKKRVREGRWQPNGGMWVEADCNVSGGEALVRQFLEGRKKFESLFGYRGDTLWLPDVFGYSAALPQILRKSGIVNFVTSKINWNDTNHFPYDLFWWRGIDGSEVFTAFITTRTNGYNAEILPESMKETWDFVQHKENQDRVLASVGWGDGGGGPTREMCGRQQRMADLEGCPKVEFTSVSRFLEGLRTQPLPLPRWAGELYLELHRGTYTSQARTKKANRTIELLLRETELFCAMASLAGAAYPSAALERCWRMLLTNQFHDILPGSSIREVYQTALEEYEAARDELAALRNSAVHTLARGAARPTESAWVVANGLNWTREEVVELPDCDAAGAVDAGGRALTVQRRQSGLAVLAKVDGLSVGVLGVGAENTRPSDSRFRLRGNTLTTPHYTVTLDKSGKITGLFDRAENREVVRAGGRLNDFYTAEDMPVFWDAWDIDRFYRDTIRPEDRLVERTVVEDGPLFMAIRSVWKIGRASTLTQDMVVYAHSRRIDFRTAVDWREKHTLLKVGFAVDVRADLWRNEIQFGHVVRPRHANTPWDQARFEVCAHKWVDVSEAGYGVALLNDCKYGHDTLDDTVSLTLLRSPQGPDPDADQGAHAFTYALLPHAGDFSAETVVREAYALNAPLTVLPDGDEAAAAPARTPVRLCSVDAPSVVVEAVKKAEKDRALILRLYEAGNMRAPATVQFSRPVRSVEECSLMEETVSALAVEENAVRIEMGPFDIRTLKVWFK